LNKNISASRRFDTVIIDEVDSMLIDENSTLARLSDNLPGMEWLSPLLHGIWRCIDSESQVESKRDTIIDNMRKVLTDPKSNLKFPTHLHRFIHESIPIWIDNAILAKVEYRLDHHYIIKSDETRNKRIMPIDFSNTGIVQPSTTWSDGLHQFLQIKHGLKLTSLTVTTNYMSNTGLFTRYEKNIYGLTGTLGSKDAQNLLYRIYKVDTVIIPPFKQKRHVQLKPILTENDDEWLKTIVSETIANRQKQRAILVICETRLDAKTISKQLQRADPSCYIRLYTDNTDLVESNVVGQRIQNGEIIVATNLAGRGTDLKTTLKVEKNGGLHVCLTFLPNNLRVEEQAFGRTSRQGNRGTSQMILSRERTFRQLMNNYPEYRNNQTTKFSNSIDLIRDWREQAERTHLERMWKDEIIDIQLKDKLFQRFRELLKKLREKDNNAYKLLNAKEQWGLWLKSMNYTIQNRTAFRLALERQGFKIEEVTQDGYSFFHAIAKQFDDNYTADDIKNSVIQHMLKYSDSYKNVTDEERHQATSEALNINLIIFRMDSRSPHIYERENAVYTCVLGYEVGSYYFSIQSSQFNDKTNTTNEYIEFEGFNDEFQEQADILNKQLSTKIIDHDLQAAFTTFEEEIMENYDKSNFIQNPCYLLMEAEAIINKLSTWANTLRQWIEKLPWTRKISVDYRDAMDRLTRAIKLDPIFTFAAQVNCAHFLINNEQWKALYKVEAKSYLVRAQKIIGKYILPQLHSMQFEQKTNNDELLYDDLVNQIRLRVEILQIYQNYVNQAIGTIEDSQKLIDVDGSIDQSSTRIAAKNLYRDEVSTFLNQEMEEVGLSFHSLKCYEDMGKNDDALKLLDSLNPEDEFVSIHFIEGSIKKIKELESIVTSERIELNIEYLDSNEIFPLIELSQCDSFSLELTATKEDYLKLITELNAQPSTEMKGDIELVTDKGRLPLTMEEILKILQDDKILVKSIYFCRATTIEADFIVLHVTQPSFTLTFSSLTIDRVKNIVEKVKKPFNYEVKSLSIRYAKGLIPKITDRTFLLKVEPLPVDRAREIIRKFKLNEQNVQSSLKRLAENFSRVDQEYDELITFGLLGINRLITVNELSPCPWYSVIVVVALGAGQIIGGVCLGALTCGFGASLGFSLIGEGVNDIVYGIRGALSRQFSWKDYAVEKGVSLAICFATLGLPAVGQLAKGAKTTIQATRQGTKVIIKTSARSTGSSSIKSLAGASWSQACKRVATTCIQTGAQELANYFSETAYQGVFSQIKSKIRDEIESTMKIKQTDKNYQHVLNRTLIADGYYNRNEWRKEMEQIAMKNLTQNKDQLMDSMKSLSKGMVNSFLDQVKEHANNTGKGKYSKFAAAGDIIKILEPTLTGASEIRTLTDSFFSQYKKDLLVFEEKIPTIEDLLLHVSKNEMSSAATDSIVKVLVKQSIITSNGLVYSRFIQNEDEKPNFTHSARPSKPSDDSIRALKEKLLEELQKIEFQDDQHRIWVETVLIKIIIAQRQRLLRITMFQKRIVDILVDQVCAIIYGSMIVPITNHVISKANLSISINDELTTSPDMTVMEESTDENEKRSIRSITKNFVEKYKNTKYQIDSEAKEKFDELIERCEIQGEETENMQEQLALDIKNGKEGGPVELCVLAVLTKKPITVLQHQLHDDMYTTILSHTRDQFASVDDMRKQCAGFIITNPTFIAGIHPVLSIISQTEKLRRWRESMEE